MAVQSSLFDRFFLGERFELNEDTRAQMSGEFLQLSKGVCQYELGGPKEGPFIVLIHGFSVPYTIWDPSFQFLVGSGWRVLRYNLYGRGGSDRPRLENTRELFVEQLEELLEALGIEQNIHVAGLSMGAIVAADFGVRNQNKVRKIIFVDPAGFDLALPLSINLLRLPGVGEFLLGVLGLFGRSRLITSMLSDFYAPTKEAVDSFLPPYLEQMKYRGFKRSLLSTLRNGLLDEDLSIFRRLNEAKMPLQLIWGKEDLTVPYKHHLNFLKMLPRTKFEEIEAAGHIPHCERAEIVNPLILDFLES